MVMAEHEHDKKHAARDEAYRLFRNGNTSLFITAGSTKGPAHGVALFDLAEEAFKAGWYARERQADSTMLALRDAKRALVTRRVTR
jgi:hypothetical protein